MTRYIRPWNDHNLAADDLLILMRPGVGLPLSAYGGGQVSNYTPPPTDRVGTVVVIEKEFRIGRTWQISDNVYGGPAVARDYRSVFRIVVIKWPERAMIKSAILEGPLPPERLSSTADWFGEDPWPQVESFVAPLIKGSAKTPPGS